MSEDRCDNAGSPGGSPRERFAIVSDLFERAIQLAAADRSAFLAENAPEDKIRAEVEDLLAQALATSTLESQLGRVADDAREVLRESPRDEQVTSEDSHSTVIDPRTHIPKKIGKYSIQQVIGTGGMGTVFLAHQQQPRRRVALKVMKHGVASRSALRRFEFESQILARLRHPNIAQVYDAGTHDDGSGAVPYFVMEYIPKAKPINEYAEEKQLAIEDRLKLFTKVCDAAHHGHQKGIIHRDLKPGNILVDSSGEPKIIDFGVARATDSDMAVTTVLTDIGQLIGTLQYMSPEQCEADPADIDIRTDVYALGVVLYELLCDELPYDVTDVVIHEAARVIQNQQPARLSTVNRTLGGDVETITMKALEKERDRRYKSAEALGHDIHKYLNNEPIEARPPSVVYQIRMFARRNRTIFAAMLAIAAVLVLATTVSIFFLVRANNAAHNLQIEVSQRETAETKALDAEQNALNEAKDAQTARDAAVDAKEEAVSQAYFASVLAARSAIKNNEMDAARRSLDRAPESHRNWEWGHFDAKSDASLVVLRGHAGFVGVASFSPDGSRIVTASSDKTARVWDMATGKEMVVLRGHETFVAAASFSPDGSRIVTASSDDTARVWDAATGDELAVLRGHESAVEAASFSFDGLRIVTLSWDNTARVWDAATGEEMVVLRGDVGVVASFSPDGSRIVTASRLGTARVWDSAKGVEVAVLLGHEAALRSASFSPDGLRIVTASDDLTSRVWDAQTGEEIAVLRGIGFRPTDQYRRDAAYAASFSPDGSRIVAVLSDRTARVWDAATGKELAALRGHVSIVSDASFSPDGLHIVSASFDRTARVWNAETGEEIATLRGHGSTILVASFSPDGSRIVTASADSTARVWDTLTSERVDVLAPEYGASFPSFSPDGARIVTAALDKTARVWDAATREEIAIFRGHCSQVFATSFSPDGSRIITVSEDGGARVWNAVTGEQVAVIGPGRAWIRTAWPARWVEFGWLTDHY